MSYVIKDNGTDQYYSGRFGLSPNLQEARVYKRLVDAKNSVKESYGPVDFIPVSISMYDNTPTVVIILATNVDGELLVIRRNNEPGRGLLGLPGGYHMKGETWQVAGAREFQEETGLWVDPESLTQVGSTVTDEYGNNLIFATTKLPSAGPQRAIDGEEVEQVMRLLECPTADQWAFPRHYEAAKSFLRNYGEPSDGELLAALQAAGVDNWQGYDYAMEILHGRED